MNTTSSMNTTKIDASQWKGVMDLYHAILPAIGAPDWHGYSIDALIDTMVWGKFNAKLAPYYVEIYSTKNLPQKVLQELSWLKEEIINARVEYNKRRGAKSK